MIHTGYLCKGTSQEGHFLRGACLASLGFIAGGKIFAAEGLNTAPILGASISGSRALVGVARGKSVKESVRKAIELSGGLDFIKAGDRVLLKPNNNANTPWPGSTNAEVVFEMVQFVREKDPSRIIVSDRSTMGLNTLKSMKESKIYDAAMDSKAEVITGEQRPYKKVNPSLAVNWPEGFSVSAILDEVDHIINLPQPKVHWITGYTMGFKNYVGLIDVPDRMKFLHRGLEWKTVGNDKKPFQPIEPISKMIPEISLAVKTSLTVMDATKSIVEGTASKGETKDPGIIIASRDQVAVDITGLALMKHIGATQFIQDTPVWEQLQIRRAIELGLGARNASMIDIRSDGVDEIDAIRKIILS